MTNISHDPAFGFMLFLHPLASLLGGQLRPGAKRV